MNTKINTLHIAIHNNNTFYVTVFRNDSARQFHVSKRSIGRLIQVLNSSKYTDFMCQNTVDTYDFTVYMRYYK